MEALLKQGQSDQAGSMAGFQAMLEQQAAADPAFAALAEKVNSSNKVEAASALREMLLKMGVPEEHIPPAGEIMGAPPPPLLPSSGRGGDEAVPTDVALMYQEQRARLAAGGQTAAQMRAAAPWAMTVKVCYRGKDRPAKHHSFKMELPNAWRRSTPATLLQHFANTINAKHPNLHLDPADCHLQSDPALWPIAADAALEECLVRPSLGREDWDGTAKPQAVLRVFVVRGTAAAALQRAGAALEKLRGRDAVPVARVHVSELTPAVFEAKYRAGAGTPVVIRGAAAATEWSLDNLVTIMGGDKRVTARFYGAGFVKNPSAWPDVGYCNPQLTTVGEFSALVRNGEARAGDVYVNSDISDTMAGRMLRPQLSKLGASCGLAPVQSMGPQVNAWWGAPGHTEPLHCDLMDGTLWQLRGRKRVVLFPAQVWQDLYPFQPEHKMSWAFAQVRHDAPDLVRFPNVTKALAHKVVVDLEEGDVLFIPGCWAHEITGLDDGGDHIFSVNRFWKTPMSKANYLPPKIAAAARKAAPNR